MAKVLHVLKTCAYIDFINDVYYYRNIAEFQKLVVNYAVNERSIYDRRPADIIEGEDFEWIEIPDKILDETTYCKVCGKKIKKYWNVLHAAQGIVSNTCSECMNKITETTSKPWEEEW